MRGGLVHRVHWSGKLLQVPSTQVQGRGWRILRKLRRQHALSIQCLRQGCKIRFPGDRIIRFFGGSESGKIIEEFSKIRQNLSEMLHLEKSQHFLDNLAKFRQILTGIDAKFVENSSKILVYAENQNLAKNLKKFDRGAKECQSCRSRKMLQNEYLIARIGADAEENEPSKIC